ncbi:unnamed protein product [Adineta steineri]|uniref:HMG box domain-containing protein n=1 Tax=Adineta steineri TaxID=433720 RepID=A0A816EUV0_9BILA|nr:unnamed protein product [Adineta steineri]CAF1652901.1 unnamed protein product [Adineta steineri]
MQHIYSNDNSIPQHDTDLYTQSNHIHQHPMHHHLQYQHENPSLSPQQSSTSDADETSTPPPSLNRGGVNVTVSAKIVKKKKQPKKKRKDPNEPQKPVSPYALFFRDTQNDIKKKLANPSFGEISKVVAHMWENIEPDVKEQYKRKAAAAKKEYLKQLAAYRAVQVSHQTPNMHHILGQNTLLFDPNSMQIQSSIQHQQKQYNTGGIGGGGGGGPMMSDNNNFLSPHHHHPHLASYNHHHHHHHHSLQQYCPPPPPPPPPPSIQQQFNNYHYINTYSQDTANVYNPDSQIHFSNHPHHFDTQQTYSSYDSNNNYGDQQQYGLLRPAIESELYSSYYTQSSNDVEHPTIDQSSISSIANENLLHNLNNNNTPTSSSNNNTPHYTDLTAMSSAATTTNNGIVEKHYDFVSSIQHGTTTLNEIENHNKEDDQSTLPISNENNFHWNQTTCLATQW